MLEVVEFISTVSSNVLTDSVLEISENTFIVKPLMVSKTWRYQFFLVSLIYLS